MNNKTSELKPHDVYRYVSMSCWRYFLTPTL